MAKQEEQQHKMGSSTQQGKPIASVPPRASAARAAVRTVSNEPAPDGTEEEKAPDKYILTKGIQRRQLLIGGLGVAATVTALGGWLWAEKPLITPSRRHHVEANGNVVGDGDQLVILWNNALLQVIRDLQPAMPVAARAMAIVHTSMFDAWAAYDRVALGTQFGARLRRAETDHTVENKSQAVSYAAYRALVDLFPKERQRFQQIMTSLKYNPANQQIDPTTPAGIGNLAAQAVLDFRHPDGSNQLGTFTHGAYSDYTHYRTINTPDEIKDPNHWQPLRVPNKHAGLTLQQFIGAQWGNVAPFALASSAQLMPAPGPARYPSSGYTEQAKQILHYSANLNNEQKAIAEYWTNGPNQEQPSGHWNLFAQEISQRSDYTLDQNIKLFFTLANALLDTSIACWATKRAYGSPYPLTAIHYLFKGKQVQAWAGPGKGMQMIDGAYWQPYQPGNLITPTCPEYCSEQSAFSSAAAEVLQRFTDSALMNLSYTQNAHRSLIEPGTPATNITLSWQTFAEAAEQAGLASRYSGTHFVQSDLDGRKLGRQAGELVWQKAQSYINGKK